MITTSITLTGFVIRQRKNNRMLGELVAQTKVENANRYSAIGVGVQNQEYVSKCPACAEWIKLEAKLCKSCQFNVEEHNGQLSRLMQNIDEEISEVNLAREIQQRAQMRAIVKSPILKWSLGFVILTMIVLLAIRIPSTIAYYKATGTPSSASELERSWSLMIDECQFIGTVNRPEVTSSDDSVSVSIYLGKSLEDFDWSTRLGKELVCFSNKALGIDVSKKLKANSINRIELRNSFSIYGEYDSSYVDFNWN